MENFLLRHIVPKLVSGMRQQVCNPLACLPPHSALSYRVLNLKDNQQNTLQEFFYGEIFYRNNIF